MVINEQSNAVAFRVESDSSQYGIHMSSGGKYSFGSSASSARGFNVTPSNIIAGTEGMRLSMTTTGTAFNGIESTFTASPASAFTYKGMDLKFIADSGGGGGSYIIVFASEADSSTGSTTSYTTDYMAYAPDDSSDTITTHYAFHAECSDAAASNYGLWLDDDNCTTAWDGGAAILTEGGDVIFNEDGGAYDFRVEGDADSGLLYVDGTNDKVYIGGGSGSQDIAFGADGAAIFNEQSNDVNFRVEGDSVEQLLFVDAGLDRVGVGTGSPQKRLHVDAGTDSTEFFAARFQGGVDDNILGIEIFNDVSCTAPESCGSKLLFTGRNVDGTYKSISYMRAYWADDVAGTEDGRYIFGMRAAGALGDKYTMTGDEFIGNGGTKNLGATGTPWNDTFTKAIQIQTGATIDYVLTDSDGSGTATWQRATPNVMDVYDNAGGQTLNASGGAATVINLDTERTSVGSDLSLASDVVTSAAGGTYLMNYRVSAVWADGTRTGYAAWIEVDGGGGFTEVDGSRAYGYTREAVNMSTATGHLVLVLSAADEVRLMGQGESNETSTTVVDASGLTITEIK